METRVRIRFEYFCESRFYRVFTNFLFPLLIAAITFAHVNKGMDITDSTYSLTNFMFADKLDSMWYYSTFYANLIGSLMIKLPLGNTILGMNIYTGIVRLAIGLIAYFFFYLDVRMEKELAFLGAFVAEAFCWCPTTILYNYLTYLFFLLGAVFLYKGLINERTIELVLAGFFLGCNFFVRLPNVAETALIAALWIFSIKDREKFGICLKKTGWCVLGYAIAFLPGVLLIAATRGVREYIKGITELFAMTDESTSYTPVSMIVSTAKAYIESWPWDEIAIFMVITGLLAFLVFPKKVAWLRYASATLVSFLYIFLFYKKNLFDVNIHYHAAIYRAGALLLTIMVVWFLGILVHRKSRYDEVLLAAISLITIAITPIGSNNQIYSNINNFFFVIPAFLFFLVRFASGNEYFRGVRYVLCILFAAIGCYAVVVGSTAVFRDGLDGAMEYRVDNNPVVKGMKTTESNAKRLEELFALWDDKDLEGSKVLLYGNVSGLGFYLNASPAISTAWPSLASFSTEKFENDMKYLNDVINEKGEEKPVIIIGREEIDGIFSTKPLRKQEILNKFIEDNNYSLEYDNESFSVYLAR